MAAPDLAIPSRDGTPIALFRSGDPDMAPVILVHGSTADHTTFRVVGPLLADRFAVYAMDRRGRGARGCSARLVDDNGVALDQRHPMPIATQRERHGEAGGPRTQDDDRERAHPASIAEDRPSGTAHRGGTRLP